MYGVKLTVTAEHKRNRFGSEYVYYHCSKRRLDYRCRQRSVTANALEQQLRAFLHDITLPPAWQTFGLERLERQARTLSTIGEAGRRSLAQARDAVERQLANLTKLRLRDLLTDTEYVREREVLERERIRLEQRTHAAAKEIDWFEPLRDLVLLSSSLVSRFEAGTEETKRLLVTTVGSNPTLADQKLLIEARKPFRRWPATPSHSTWWAGKDSNLRSR